MAMPDTARRYTVEEVWQFPEDGNRYELVHGELLVTPSPRLAHQVVVGELYAILREYLKPHREPGRVLLSPADITWGSDEDLVQPDVFVAASDEVKTTWDQVRTLLLAAEVVSPSSTRYDRVTKRRLYQERRVETYWVVDADARLVEVWYPDDERPEIVTNVLTWRVAEEAEKLRIRLDQLFEVIPS